MKKIIVALAAIAMTAGFAANADVCNNKPCDKQCNKPCNQPCDTACTNPCAQAQFCPFDGLNLTDAQKQQFKDLRAKRQQAKKDAKADRKADRKAAKKAQLDEIKSILTPEQYTLFLENHFVNGNGSKVAARAGKPNPRDARAHKGAPRGERPAKQRMAPAQNMKAEKR